MLGAAGPDRPSELSEIGQAPPTNRRNRDWETEHGLLIMDLRVPPPHVYTCTTCTTTNLTSAVCFSSKSLSKGDLHFYGDV